ncbi:glycoside hydrolase family 18 protein [Schizophyllum amplum]|uniref:Glycoside hydrolase family 18 protein n=1 Tax=Schizophyllum amplum TaxID=97359 RepID=A0A550CSD6_9AGAR|nr:glycoside hydrolase family 18 protein [Auriculariopsis ampla]
MGYYPDWTSATLPPEKVDFSRYDWMDFAFALPTQDFNLTWDDPNAPALLTRLVSAAHAKDKKVKLSIGGWTGSKYFSSSVATNDSRETFTSNVVSVFEKYSLDGIDIDWEYPGRAGNDGNLFAPQDSSNFLAFLQLLRAKLPPAAHITAATLTTPFIAENGAPSADVSEFAKVLNWITMMNYDVWGAAANPGPNAPFFDACHNSTQPQASAVAGYQQWTDAGFPGEQIVLGIPYYGYRSRSDASRLRTRDDFGDDAQVEFRDLVASGALVKNPNGTSPMFVGGDGFTREWDECSGTPYLVSSAAHQVISYDDPESLGMKAKWVKEMGMMGVNTWDIHGDTDDLILANTVLAAMDRSS